MLVTGSKKEGAAAAASGDVTMFLAPGTAGAADGSRGKEGKPKKKRKSEEDGGGEAAEGKKERKKKKDKAAAE